MTDMVDCLITIGKASVVFLSSVAQSLAGAGDLRIFSQGPTGIYKIVMKNLS